MKETGQRIGRVPNDILTAVVYRSSGVWRSYAGTFDSIGSNGNWWSSTDQYKRLVRHLFYNYGL
jgi:hypothetical protein